MGKGGARRRWSADDQRRLVELRAEGKSIREIAAAIGRSVGAVAQRCMRLDVTWAAPRVRRVLPLVSVPHAVADVAARLGMTADAVRMASVRLARAGHAVCRPTG